MHFTVDHYVISDVTLELDTSVN